MTTLRTHADVATATPDRYAKQLMSHLGHRLEFTPEGESAWRTSIGDATARIAVTEGVLHMSAEAPDDESLARAEDVLGRHLERFGQRQELVAAWERDTD